MTRAGLVCFLGGLVGSLLVIGSALGAIVTTEHQHAPRCVARHRATLTVAAERAAPVRLSYWACDRTETP